VRAGDREAYAELVRRHAPVALRTARMMGAGADADDVVQDAFVKAYESLGGFRQGAAFRPWLLRIVGNETRNLHRAAGRRAAREWLAWERTERLVTPDSDPEATTVTDERRDELLRGIATLSYPQQQVITCRYLLDLDEAETAALLGWSRGTVKSRLHRGLRHLAEALDTASAGALRSGQASEANRGS
jgi:RNA polymerase sigma factor (sigma-70 family)